MKLTFDVPEEIAEKIAENIKIALDEYKKKQVWPQEGDSYYYMTDDGDILYDIYDDLSDKDRLQFGNMFKTKEEAEFKREQLKVLQELEQLADDDQEWACNNLHHKISYNHAYNDFIIDHWQDTQDCQFLFKSEESARKAINTIGEERLKKYYFCVPEEE